jgi:hypothetical protein
MEVFTALGHDPLVSSDDEKHKVYAACAREHIFYKSFVAGDVYDANCEPVGVSKVCETQVNGDAALFLFLEPVRVYACQRLHKSALAVVDVSCGAEYYVTHG